MLIRCEKCATLYELDDNLLPPGGAPVQCSRCQYVFTAYPNRKDGTATAAAAAPNPEEGSPAELDVLPAPAPTAEASAGGLEVAVDSTSTRGPSPAGLGASAAEGEAIPGAPGSERAPETEGAARDAPTWGEAEGVDAPGDSAPSPPPAVGASAEEPGAGAARLAPRSTRPVNGTSSGSDEPKFTADGRPIRKVPFPGDESALSPRKAMARPLPRVPAKVGARARPAWLVPVVVAVVLAVAALLAWRILAARRAGEQATPRRSDGRSSLLRVYPGDRREGVPTPVSPQGKGECRGGKSVSHPGPA